MAYQPLGIFYGKSELGGGYKTTTRRGGGQGAWARKRAEDAAAARAAQAAQARQANQQLRDQLVAAQEAANRANQERFMQALQEQRYAATRMREQFDVAKRGLATLGQKAEADIAVGSRRMRAAEMQRMMTSGLAGTTAVAAAGRGVEEERGRAMLGVQEMRQQGLAGLATQRAGMEMEAGRARTGLLSSFQEQGPNLGMYMNLLQQGGMMGGQGLGGAAGTTGPVPPPIPGVPPGVGPELPIGGIAGMMAQARRFATPPTGGFQPGTSSLVKSAFGY